MMIQYELLLFYLYCIQRKNEKITIHSFIFIMIVRVKEVECEHEKLKI